MVQGEGISIADAAEAGSATQIVECLPRADYTRNYQPTYPDMDELIDAVHELQATEATTTPRHIDALQIKLAQLALGEIQGPLIITGRCAEPVELTTPIETLAQQAVANHDIAITGIATALVIERNRGQNTKPRSASTETLPDGTVVAPYMGDAVNSQDPEHRTPDPSRMVAAAVQARDLEAALTNALGEHMPAAHEALLLPYELSFVRPDAETGRTYLLSADMPWIGKRTNDPEGEHVALLAEVENPVGIKIGPDSTETHIQQLQEKLNPEGIPGKLTFMLRMGLQNTEALRNTLGAIKTYAPESLVIYDIHGSTKTAENGAKTRVVSDIIEEIQIAAAACKESGLKLHGVHLETITDDTRMECVDEPGQLPTHPGGVDPQLNPRQTVRVLQAVAPHLL